MIRKAFLTVLVLFVATIAAHTQFIVPATQQELIDFERERQIRAFIGIDLAVTHANEYVADSLTGRRMIVSQIMYNQDGNAETIMYYDSAGNYNGFELISYYENKMPMERIRFSADSVMISGILYEYDEAKLVTKIINYRSPATLVTESIYIKKSDKVLIENYDAAKNLIFKEKRHLEINEDSQRYTLIQKSDKEDYIFESVYFEYSNGNRASKKQLVSDVRGKMDTYFTYSHEGALIAKHEKDLIEGTEIIATFEYDEFGNLTKIIDRNAKGEVVSYLTISYFSKNLD